jgi:hypothetical protein
MKRRSSWRGDYMQSMLRAALRDITASSFGNVHDASIPSLGLRVGFRLRPRDLVNYPSNHTSLLE